MIKYLIILAVALISGILAFQLNLTNSDKKTSVQNETVGVTPTEIIIGSSAALSGTTGYLGTNYMRGAMSYINRVNDGGGVNGRKIKIISLDDQYDPPKTISNTQKLISDHKVFALFNYVGTPTIIKVLPLIEEAKIPLVGLFTGANTLRDPFRKYIFNIRASYYQETEEMMRYSVDSLGLSRIAVFYQSDAYGLDGLEGVKIALKKRGLEIVGSGSYNRGTTEVEKAVEEIAKTDPELIIMVGTYSPSAKFIKLYKAKNLPAKFYSVSFVGPHKFLEVLGDDAEGVMVTQVVPPPSSNTYKAVEEFNADLEKSYPGEHPMFGSLEGYINAKVLVEALKRSGRNVTRTGFINALESLDNYDVGIDEGVTFSSNNHQAFNRIYSTIIEKGEFVLINQ